MADRFFCPNLSHQKTELPDSEAHHAIHVLRLKESQSIQLFDGVGKTATGIIRSIGRSVVSVEVQDVRSHTRRQDTLTVAAAAPKGDRLKWMIEKLTELGVDRYIPLRTKNSVVDPRQTKLEKLKTTVISAAKQSEQNWLMQIGNTADYEPFVEHSREANIFIAHPNADRSVGFDSVLPHSTNVLLIGPEGGFTDEEVLFAEQAGGTRLCLPDSILRIETAAVTFAAFIKLQSHSIDETV